MYFNKKMRRKKLDAIKKNSKPQQLQVIRKYKKKRGNTCYLDTSIYNSNPTLKPINYFIKQIRILTDTTQNLLRLEYYNSFNMWVKVSIKKEVFDILHSPLANWYVLSNGIILVHTLKEIFITYDFFKYQIINVSELKEYFNHDENYIYSIRGISEDNEIILTEYKGYNEYYLPFKTKCDFSYDNADVMLYLKYEK